MFDFVRVPSELANSKYVLTKVLYSGTKDSASKYWKVLRSRANIELALFTFSLICLSKLNS